MWLAVLEDDDGVWFDDPLPTEGTKAGAINNAHAMWPIVPEGHRIVLYWCRIECDVPE